MNNAAGSSLTNFKRTLVLAIVIILGALLNINQANAMSGGNPSFTSITKMYSKACRNLNKKQGKTKNLKVRLPKKPLWR